MDYAKRKCNLNNNIPACELLCIAVGEVARYANVVNEVI
jgi:hypothetical protein